MPTSKSVTNAIKTVADKVTRRAVFTRMIVARDGTTYKPGDYVPEGLEKRYIKRGCAREA